MTEEVKTWGSIVGLVTLTILTRFDAWRVKRMVDASDKKSNAVKQALEATDAEKAAKLNEIHRLVNGSSGKLMRTVMLLSKELAEVRPSPSNLQTAELAKKDYEEHLERTAIADRAIAAMTAGKLQSMSALFPTETGETR